MKPRLKKYGSEGLLVLVILLGVSCVIAGAVSWFPDHAIAGRFQAAEHCAAEPRSSRTDCITLMPTRVTGASTVRGTTSISLEDGSYVQITYAPDAIAALHGGEAVEAIVWQGSVQGVETPGGVAGLSDDSVAMAPLADCIGVLLGLAVLCFAAMPAATWFGRRRGSRGEAVKTVRWCLAAFGTLASGGGFGVVIGGSVTGAAVGVVVAGTAVLLVLALIASARYVQSPYTRPRARAGMRPPARMPKVARNLKKYGR
jgi:hypothetical protein